MTEDDTIQELLSQVCATALEAGFVGCGVATSGSFHGVPDRADPRRILEGYRAVLVLAAPPELVTSSGPYGPVLLETVLSEALAVVRGHLEGAGYQVRPVVSGDVSLPRAAVAAGLGEVSPVGALVAEEYGLSLTLVGMVTDAALLPLPAPSAVGGICGACGLCTEDCPATLPGSFDAAWCTGCGVCVASCPLGPG
ncbi:MAG: 4Fe-4S binding protein [Thermoleophilia bacterium]